MGLTKPRAAQIYNLDYKQSTRVITTTNITLSGGAPNAVDGVNLVLNDRILVIGQTTGSQNGIYRVSTLGSGSNGTWVRTSDTNETGEIEAGMIVMVTEGTVYADTQWKLITDDPITVGTTTLTFVQNYFANSISAGTSNVVVNSNANVNISSAGTANVLTVSNTGAFVTGVTSVSGNVLGGNVLTAGLISATANITGGNILTAGVVSATGNVTANYFIGNGACLTGVVTSLANINNGNSNVTVIANSNVTVNIAGTSNVAVFSTSGLDVTGRVSASGNITGSNILTAGLVTATGNVTAGNILTAGLISATGNITTAGSLNLTGNIVDTNALTISTGTGDLTLSPAGNISAGTKYINNVINPVQDQDAATKNYVDNAVSTAISYHQAVTAASTDTMATTTGGTITYAQPNGASNGVGATLTTTGSFNLIDTANVQTVGTRILIKNEANAVFNGVYTWTNATAITRSTDTDTYGAGNTNSLGLNDYFFVTSGNVNKGSAYVVSAPTGTITFGTSNITFAQFSNSQTYTANTSAGISLAGTVINAKVDNTTTAFDGGGNISVKASANLTTPNIGAATGTSLSVTGNVDGANIRTAGLVTATGNVTGGNVTTAGAVTATGNVTAGNILTAGLISATSSITSAANVVGGNISTTGLITATGNATAGNILTSGLVSATGNINGGNIGAAGTVLASGALSVSGSTVFNNSATAADNIGPNKTTGTINIGSTGGTGTINIGQSTASQTLLLATGATTSGNTKTINIGSGGLANSTTTMVIGPSTGTGGAGTLTVNNNTTVAIANTGGSALSVAGNVTGGNILTAGIMSSTGNATAGNILTAGIMSATGVIVSNGGYIRANSQLIVDSYSGSSEGGQISLAWTGVNGLTGQGNGTWNLDVDSSNTFRTFYQNATGGTNVVFTLNSTNQTANFSGNIGASYYYGNGAFLTGLSAGSSNGISNGATSISIPVSSGNITMSVAGQSNTVVINLGSFTMYGSFATPKTLEANVAVANAVNAVLFGPVTLGNAYNISVPSDSTLYIYSGA